MKSLLVHIASFAVIFHMTFGCSVHHGLGSANACVSQSGMSTCCHDGQAEPMDCDDHEDQGHDHCSHDQELPNSQSTVNYEGDGSNHSHSHLGCQDDGCSVTKVVKFVIEPLDFSTAYSGGAEDSVIATSSTNP